jgi:hypothetical protein
MEKSGSFQAELRTGKHMTSHLVGEYFRVERVNLIRLFEQEFPHQSRDIFQSDDYTVAFYSLNRFVRTMVTDCIASCNQGILSELDQTSAKVGNEMSKPENVVKRVCQNYIQLFVEGHKVFHTTTKALAVAKQAHMLDKQAFVQLSEEVSYVFPDQKYLLMVIHRCPEAPLNYWHRIVMQAKMLKNQAQYSVFSEARLVSWLLMYPNGNERMLVKEFIETFWPK